MEKVKKAPVFMIRIAITGPESSGKTTLAQYLAHEYQATLVEEYAREYLTGLARPYTMADVEEIGREQLRRENEAGGPLVICDTDVIVLKIWFTHKYGRVPAWLEEAINSSRYTHHLLTRPDVPYEPDPLRENPEAGEYFFDLYRQELEYYEFDFTIIEGSFSQRRRQSKKAVNSLIDSLS
jgi:nicotinamide riboside kinase